MNRLTEIGQQLKAAREARKRSLEDIATETHLKASHLEALEAGDESRLPEPVYIKSFIRKYAQAVGLPADELANQYWETRPLPPAPAETREFNPPWWIFPWLLGLVLIVALLAIAWHLNSRSQSVAPSPTPSVAVVVPPPAATHSAAPAIASRSIAPHAATTSVATPHGATVSVPAAHVSPAPHATPAHKPSPKPAVKPSAKPSPKPSAKPTAKPTAHPSPKATTAPSVTTPAPATTSANVSGNSTKSTVLKLRAVHSSWVRVVRNGHELYSETMRPGQTKSWPIGSGLSVTIGNASGVQATLGDKPLGPLGGEGQVVRRVFK